ncbi:MAG: transglycosylase SLT domain-containing protein [Pseudobdellovibrionaceae bacterium]
MNLVLRHFLLFIVIPLTSIAISCTSTRKKEDLIDSRFESQLMLYKKARQERNTNPEQACDVFSRLSREENFPLKSLASLRSQFFCKSEDVKAKPNLEAEPWLNFLDLEKELYWAERSGDSLRLAKALLRKSQVSDRIRDKVAFLQRGLIEAKKTEDKSLQAEMEERLFKFAPRLMGKIEKKDYYRVGVDLIYQRQFQEGRSYLQKVFENEELSFDERYQAQRAYRSSYKTELKRNDHIIAARKLNRWLEKMGHPSRHHEAALILARALWTEGDRTEAQKELDRAEKILKKRVPLDEIYFVRGKMAEEVGDYAKAIEMYAVGEKNSNPRTSHHERVLFAKAWSLRKLQRYSEAAESLQTLKTESTDPFDINRYSFWLARSLVQSGKQQEAQQELEWLTVNDPLGFYGLVAHRDLNRDLPPLALKDEDVTFHQVRSIPDSTDQYLRALIFVEENEVLERFLLNQTQNLKSDKTKNPEQWLYYLKAYARGGLFLPLFSQMGTLEPSLRAEILKRDPELLFPRKFAELIEENGERFNVRPELMLSIIRQESAFNPFARSPADAMGLMQVLPSVAKAHEKHTGIKVENFEDLFKPEINIPVGASLLNQLQRRYRGQFLLTAAAYNASERAIEGWLKTRLKEDPLEFIEDIPYEETRGYVKLVLRNFIFYKRLKQPNQSMPFPQWCLEDLQSVKNSTTGTARLDVKPDSIQ